MENDFIALLANDATIAGLVSTRIYPVVYTQATINPAIRYRKITGSIGIHMQGSDGLSTDLMQVDVRALKVTEILSIRDAVVAKLHAFAGTQGSTVFKLIELRSDRGTDFETNGAQEFYTRSMDFDVYSRDAA